MLPHLLLLLLLFCFVCFTQLNLTKGISDALFNSIGFKGGHAQDETRMRKLPSLVTEFCHAYRSVEMMLIHKSHVFEV